MTHPGSAHPVPPLTWPPPGLESIQGVLAPGIRTLALGEAVLLLTHLPDLMRAEAFWRLGLAGEAWWLPVLLTAVGLVIVVAGVERLVRLLWFAARATDSGHPWLRVLEVAADTRRDMGFLLQGARRHAHVPVEQRQAMVLARLVAVSASLLAVGWIALAFPAVIVLAGRGLLDSSTVLVSLLGVPSVGGLVWMTSRVAVWLFEHAARRDRSTAETSRDEVDAWNTAWKEREGTVDARSAPRVRGRLLRIGAAGVVVVGLALTSVALTLGLTGTIGPVLASIAVPRIAGVQARIMEAEALRPLRLPTDTDASPEAAGAALHTLTAVGHRGPSGAVLRPPPRAYQQPWFPAGTPPERRSPRGIRDLFSRLGGLEPEERAFLAEVASHPAHGEFTIVAEAAEVDILGARYVVPFPDTLTSFALPLPAYGTLNGGVQAHLAKAVYEASRNRANRAERTVREVVSVGFALMDHGPLMIDVLVGARMVRQSGEALVELYRASGRRADAEALAWVLDAADGGRQRSRRPPGAVEASLGRMARVVTDTTVLPGVRWEYFMVLNGLAPCLNARAVVFGPDTAFGEWVARARVGLVRRPSEQAYFDLLRRGWFGGAGADGGWLAGVLGGVMGGEGPAGSCAAGLAAAQW